VLLYLALTFSQNAIDLDQRAIQSLLALDVENSFEKAKIIHQEGAFCKSVATLNLTNPLSYPLQEGALLSGTGKQGKVRGKLLETIKKGETILRVQYEVSSVQQDYGGCQVGGNPNLNTDGCK
jgi:hypothetical protein